MSTPKLGRIETVDPRIVWPSEPYDFTPWLLENVDVLAQLLGIELVLEQAEHPVGDFYLDLVGKDLTTGGPVIVENQLGVSDHTHLGQIITYAAGTKPTTIVWVTTGFRPEHRSAIDWLNEQTGEGVRVFGVVIKVVRIGDSEIAPDFELVAQPDEWQKAVRRVATNAAGGNAKAVTYGEFWTQALNLMRAEHPTWTRGTTSNQSFADTGLGTSGVVISMTWYRAGLVAQIYFNHADAAVNADRFAQLLAKKEAFEAALGLPVVWNEMPGRKAARIVVSSPFGDVGDREQWEAAARWLVDTQVALRAAYTAVGGVS